MRAGKGGLKTLDVDESRCTAPLNEVCQKCARIPAETTHDCSKVLSVAVLKGNGGKLGRFTVLDLKDDRADLFVIPAMYFGPRKD